MIAEQLSPLISNWIWNIQTQYKDLVSRSDLGIGVWVCVDVRVAVVSGPWKPIKS